MKIRIAHFFPELLNLYADQGNIAVLVERARRRGIEVQVTRVKLGSDIEFEGMELALLGGGSDREQAVVGRELARYRNDLRLVLEAGMPILAVCGGYQLIGEYYELAGGERIKGLGLVEMATKSGKNRLIGNVAIEWTDSSGRSRGATVVGFENHVGRTEHDHPAFGRVLKGHGNNGHDQREGIQYKGLIGTYIHGPLLPKNPHIADRLLECALAYRGLLEPLAPLDDALEWRAHDRALAIAGVAGKGDGANIHGSKH